MNQFEYSKNYIGDWDNHKELCEKLDRACYYLITVWQQYNSWGCNDDGKLIHADMSTGEEACDFLEDLGLCEIYGYSADLTQRGKDLVAHGNKMGW